MKKLALIALTTATATLLSSCVLNGDFDENTVDEALDNTVYKIGGDYVEQIDYEVVNTYPADPSSFTQGLEIDDDGYLMVGTGINGESEVYRRTIDDPEKITSAPLADEYFGEGITIHGPHLWQVTWKSGIAVKRDAGSLIEISSYDYPGEGWGLCSSQDNVFMSDGSDVIRIMNPHDFSEEGTITVTLDGEPVDRLNELECVDGDIYANEWMTENIYRIDVSSGEVTGVIDASGLENTSLEVANPDNVLNGIAYREETDTFLLTGKRWSDIYEVELR